MAHLQWIWVLIRYLALAPAPKTTTIYLSKQIF